MGETFEISLDQVLLKGFQRFKLQGYPRPVSAVSDLVIAKIIEGIQSKAQFEPVVVEKNYEKVSGHPQQNGYRLSLLLDESWRRRGQAVYVGGHNRAVAHLIEGQPLLCRYRKEGESEYFFIRRLTFYPIHETLILPDSVLVDRDGNDIGLKMRRQMWASERRP